MYISVVINESWVCCRAEFALTRTDESCLAANLAAIGAGTHTTHVAAVDSKREVTQSTQASVSLREPCCYSR